MNQSQITSVLAEHYRALIEFSELGDGELLQTSLSLCALDHPTRGDVEGVLLSSELAHWRMAAGECLWDGSLPSVDFLKQKNHTAVDTWKESTPQVAERLIAEVLRVI